ncbi:MAG: hypothetical protein VX589_01985 [Myxococcota bacterium]|nr:hypothetical protein [Myxococcota bacterium]
MSNGVKFFVRRDDKNYRVQDLDTLRRWLEQGRVCGRDLIYDVDEATWYRVQDWVPLASEWTELKERRQNVDQAPSTYWVHRNGESVSVSSLDKLFALARAGRLAPDDLVMHAGLDSWFRVDASPALLAALPDAMRENPHALLPVVLDPFATVHEDKSVSLDASSLSASASGSSQNDPNLSVDAPNVLGDESPIRATDESALPGALWVADVTTTTEDTPVIMSGNQATGGGTETASVTIQSFEHSFLDGTDFTDSTTQPEHGPVTDGADFGVFYKIARVHMVVRELRPDTRVAGSCPDPVSDRDWVGAEKVEVFLRLRAILVEIMPTFSGLLHEAVVGLVEILSGCEDVIGKKPPHRLVIGHRAGPKMTAEEESLMAAVDDGLKEVFAHKPPNG